MYAVMNYKVLAGSGCHGPQKDSPVRAAKSLLRRPRRFLMKLVCALLIVGTMSFFALGENSKFEIQQTASALKRATSAHIIDTTAQYRRFEGFRSADEVSSMITTRKAFAMPTFHLLIPSNVSSANVCKTLLSGAVSNYPPPTLVGYQRAGWSEIPGADLVNNTLHFLKRLEVDEGDLVMIMEEDSWFQLPAEITVKRFLHGMRDATAKSVAKYGRVCPWNGTLANVIQPPTFSPKVLFGAMKECSNNATDPACLSIPKSPLPKDIYGSQTDKNPDVKYDRPRFMGSSMVMGTVVDLRPIYERAMEMLGDEEIGPHGSQFIFSQIFGEQEYARNIALRNRATIADRWHEWLKNKLSKDTISADDITLSPARNYEFGIELDYSGSVFQVMHNSVDDIRFVTFDQSSIIASSSQISASIFKNRIHLPLDLSLAKPPYDQNRISTSKPIRPQSDLDNITGADANWADVSLATNVIVPGSSVPASLNFHGSEDYLQNLWPQMWFYKNARALMRQYARSTDGQIAAAAAADGGGRWWDLRGGKGGVWTDREEWFAWSEVCGAYDAEVFGDGKGKFGRESVAIGGRRSIYNMFGQLIEGREPEEHAKKEEVLATHHWLQRPGDPLTAELKFEKSVTVPVIVEQPPVEAGHSSEMETTEIGSTHIETNPAAEAELLGEDETQLQDTSTNDLTEDLNDEAT